MRQLESFSEWCSVLPLRSLLSFVILLGLFLGTGCQPIPVTTDGALETASAADPVLPTKGDVEMTPTLPTPASSPQTLIERAKTDLAQRLSVPVNDIILLQAESVTWPDSSLGCPEEGMLYTQVLTPGYLIRLQAGDREFEYHAGRSTEVVYCEDPMPPVEGTPGDV